MPKLKKSKRAEFLDCIGENIRLCVKIFGIEKISAVMCLSESTVRNRVRNPSGITAEELFMLSEYVGAEPEDFIRPLKIFGGGHECGILTYSDV